ncbi:hypothetical protein [Pengzhenrongella sp.]|jgi:F0F1-type ATP synthase beta subunit|uniref:hypothetical protein n=1 Tax=Pengzhenrongella sp. TaxID=2888820 RepID=UPI002F938A43
MFITPLSEEMSWARGGADTDEHLLALVVLSRCFARLGYFPALDEAVGVGQDVNRRV